MIIGMLHGYIDYTEQCYIEELVKRGAEVRLCHWSEMNFEYFESCDKVLCRVGPNALGQDKTKLAPVLNALDWLSKNNKLMYVHMEAVKAEFDKYFEYLLAKSKNVAVAKTLLFSDLAEALEAANSLNYPVILKPRFGACGKNVHKAHNAEELKSYLDSLNSRQFEDFVLQEFLQSCEGLDYRVAVLNGEVLYAYSRSFVKLFDHEDPWLGSVSKGSTRSLDVPDAIQQAAVAISRKLGVGFIGLDLIRTNMGIYMIEGNLCPDISKKKDIAIQNDVIGALVDDILAKRNMLVSSSEVLSYD